jgi:lysophospholipase L1-like esterase
MKTLFSQILAGAVALTAFSILGCGSSGDNPSTAPGSGGGQGGAIASSSSESAGGATTSPTSSAPASGGTPATAGQSQASSVPQGGSASGGAVTSATSTPATGGSAGGGGASGGGSAKGGSAADAGVIGGSPTGDAAAGGKTTAGGSTGAPDGAATGGKMTTDGAAGGIVTGGTSAAGGSPPLGGGKGSSDGTTPITVWMAGDSTMSGSGCDGGGWGDQFGSVFNSNVTVQNKSVAGRSIQTWLYEKNVSSTAGANGECTLTATTYSDNWNSMLTGMKTGDWLFIEFGINDGDGTCPRHVGTALFQTYLTTMAKAASDRGAQAVFLTSTSAIACNGSTAQANRGFGPQTKAAGTADNCPVIDVTTLSAALYTSLGLCPNSNDYTSTTSKVGQFFCNDHTHFEKAGGLQIAQMVGKALKDQGIGLAAYLAN